MRCKRCGTDIAESVKKWDDIFLTLACELCVECSMFDAQSSFAGQLTIWDAIENAPERAR